MCSRFTGLNDDCGLLLLLVVVGLQRTWDRLLVCCSRSRLLSSFQFRLAVTEQYCLFNLVVSLRTPHSARISNRARQWQLIRAELPTNGYPQSSGSSKNARQWHFIRAERSSNGSCRSHRALEASSLPSCFVLFFFLPRCDPRSFILFYDVTDAGPASHRVRLWQGGPASIFDFVRVRVFFEYMATDALKFASTPGPLRGSRGYAPMGADGGGCSLLCAVFQMRSLLPCTATVNGAADHNRGEVAETPPLAWTQGRTVDCSFNVYGVCVSSHTWS